MTTVAPSKVPFTEASIEKCRCGYCPVQSDSNCIKQVESQLPKNRKKVPLKHEEVPGVYCASGKATCNDLNFKSSCVYGTCSIFNEEYHFADNSPAGYFCKGGKAR
jgi:hypothetical protein